MASPRSGLSDGEMRPTRAHVAQETLTVPPRVPETAFMAMDTTQLLEVLGGMVQELNAATKPEEAAVAVLEIAGGLFGGWDAAYVAIYYEEDGTVSSVYFADTEDHNRIAVPLPARKEPTEYALRVIKECAKLLHRTEDELCAPSELRGFGITRKSASLMHVPMMSGSRPYGIMSVQSYELNKYTGDDLVVLQMLGNCCAGTLARIEAERSLAEKRGG